jgi:alpha-L-arabinofuranosidase
MTEPGGPAWRQTIFHPFARTAALAKGDVLETRVDCPTYETARYGEAALVDAVATHDAATGDVTLFVVNRDLSDPIELTVDLSAFGSDLSVAESWTLTDDDVRAANTRDDPDRVTLRPTTEVPTGAVTTEEHGPVILTLPRVSWTALRLTRS